MEFDHYKQIFESFVRDGMSDNWAKLEVCGRILQDVDAHQFDLAVELINKLNNIRFCDEHNQVETKWGLYAN